MRGRFDRLNERLAMWGTKAFGNMWAFYIFFVWGILGMLPWLNDSFRNLVLLISSAWIQLWALPLLAVGNSVLNKSSEKRATEDHRLIKSEFDTIKSILESQNVEMATNKEILDLLKKILDKLSV